MAERGYKKSWINYKNSGGALNVDIVALDYGITINRTETEGRSIRTVYFGQTVFDNFMITMKFNRHSVFDSKGDLFPNGTSYEGTSTWFMDYAHKACNPATENPTPIVVASTIAYSDGTSPGIRNFIGVGVPSGGPAFGDKFDEFSYTMVITFIGTAHLLSNSDPVLANESGSFKTSRGGPTQSAFFYPSGNQQTSPAQTVEEILYNGLPNQVITSVSTL